MNLPTVRFDARKEREVLSVKVTPTAKQMLSELAQRLNIPKGQILEEILEQTYIANVSNVRK